MLDPAKKAGTVGVVVPVGAVSMLMVMSVVVVTHAVIMLVHLGLPLSFTAG